MITIAYSLVGYYVTGLSSATCDHCVAAIKADLIKVPGVVGVEVDPAAGKVSVLTNRAVDEDLVRAAMDLAGCEIVGSAIEEGSEDAALTPVPTPA
ncbi:heavy-metal-associated domain-containing protein [Microtetraspora malaysiensis]|uniref:heavy-metal-associated domain-containing protein n=1 Tax=Microtetraspora malaysiensis TaxID=161358 RepID=UPI003D8C76D6